MRKELHLRVLFAQVLYLSLRKEGASAAVAAATASHQWDVSGIHLVDAEACFHEASINQLMEAPLLN